MSGAKQTTTDLLERLRYWALRKEDQGFYAVMLEEVSVDNGSRRLDALVMNCVPSRGLTLVGYEVKATRTDWLKELASPDKADAAAEYLDAFYLVTVPGVVEPGELPDRWGLMLPKARKNLAVEVEAKPQEGKDTPRSLLAGILRRAIRQELEREIDGAVARAAKDARERVEADVERWQGRAEIAEEQAEFMRREWAEFNEIAGVEFGSWYRNGDAQKIARLHALLSNKRDGADSLIADLKQRAEQSRRVAARIDELVDEVSDVLDPAPSNHRRKESP